MEIFCFSAFKQIFVAGGLKSCKSLGEGGDLELVRECFVIAKLLYLGCFATKERKPSIIFAEAGGLGFLRG